MGRIESENLYIDNFTFQPIILVLLHVEVLLYYYEIDVLAAPV